MGEFELIRKYFTLHSNEVNLEQNCVQLGIGDDCALINIPYGDVLAVSTDTFLEGTHFFKDTNPFAIGFKSLAVNLSDLAAMGAEPVAFTLALTLPDSNEDFIAEFSRGLFTIADRFRISLVGGDTTRGPLSVTITVMGKTPCNGAIRRSGARDNDVICVSGALGGAAYGVALRYDKSKIHGNPDSAKAFNLLDYPNPRMDLVPFMHKYRVNSALDISDGFLGDLKHILDSSEKSAEIDIKDIPISEALHNLPADEQLNYALNGGDDYEICFTLSEKDYLLWQDDYKSGKAPKIYRVGTIKELSDNRISKGNRVTFTENGKAVSRHIDRNSFSHF